MNVLRHIHSQIYDILGGTLLGRELPAADAIETMQQFLKRLFRVPDTTLREEGGSAPPAAGKPSPLRPAPTHHLVATRSLPPSKGTHLFPKD